MLAIRMQRTGRKGHAMFRMIVQESRLTPTSGKVVAWLGSYDPHAKTLKVDKEKAGFYLEHGAQPSERVAYLLKNDGVKLPAWAVASPKKDSKTRFPDKRRSTAPAEEKPAEPAAEESVVEAEAAPVETAPDAEATAEAAAEPKEVLDAEPEPEIKAEEPAKEEAEPDANA